MDFVITAIDGFHRDDPTDVKAYKIMVEALGGKAERLGLRVTAQIKDDLSTYFGCLYLAQYIFYCEMADEQKYHIGDTLHVEVS